MRRPQTHRYTETHIPRFIPNQPCKTNYMSTMMMNTKETDFPSIIQTKNLSKLKELWSPVRVIVHLERRKFSY